jgi:hypothetical protein
MLYVAFAVKEEASIVAPARASNGKAATAYEVVHTLANEAQAALAVAASSPGPSANGECILLLWRMPMVK